jgi:tRNA (cytidine56-2'-O)-methyltransferase
MKKIVVLRYGHRLGRDERVTTHVALVARAFGANAIFIDTKDKKIEERLNDVTNRFGGKFEITTGVDCKNFIEEWKKKGFVVHLTMYGNRLDESLERIPNSDVLIVVGAKKVPSYFYELADLNVSIGNQPHSEVAALAIFLDRLTKGKWIDREFNGKIKIIPSDKKLVEKKIDGYKILEEEGCSKLVINHCKKVHSLAMKMAKKAIENGAKLDLSLVSIGAMLHDIGRSKTHGIRHAIEGAKIAKERRFPLEVVRIIERHIGAGLNAKEAEKLGLPKKDYIPKTLEEKIVAHADNLIDDVDEAIKELNGKNKEAEKKMIKLHKELSDLCGIDLRYI